VYQRGLAYTWHADQLQGDASFQQGARGVEIGLTPYQGQTRRSWQVLALVKRQIVRKGIC
jgi:hypothetical protein